MDTFREILNRLPPSVYHELSLLPQADVESLQEIRLRCGQRIALRMSGREKHLTRVVSKEDLSKILASLIKFSYYAYEEDLARGFITIEGGHRVGICGKVVAKNGQPALIKEISSMNIRFTKEIKGCANVLLPRLLTGSEPHSVLIASPPGCGKTTLLRDIARLLSMRQIQVAICDERSEIAGMYNSAPSFDLGPRTDVLDGCDKVHGIPLLIRSMAPQVIITDEIGKSDDVTAAWQCLSAGVRLISSIHGSSRSDLNNSAIAPLLERKFFRHIVYLSAAEEPGKIERIENA